MKNALIVALCMALSACNTASECVKEALRGPNFRQGTCGTPTGKWTKRVSLAPRIVQAPANTETAVTLAPSKDGSLLSMLLSASKEGVPLEILYGIKGSETGHHTGNRANLGKCNAKEQLMIYCSHELKRGKRNGNGCKHLVALGKMAKLHGWNLEEIPGSCGKATWAKDANEHGGAIGEMQTMPHFYFIGKYGKKDPFNPWWAAHHAASVLRQYHDESRSTDPRIRWRWAVERYRGSPGSAVAEKYYWKVAEHGQRVRTWKRAGILAECVDQPSAVECFCAADPDSKRCVARDSYAALR